MSGYLKMESTKQSSGDDILEVNFILCFHRYLCFLPNWNSFCIKIDTWFQMDLEIPVERHMLALPAEMLSHEGRAITFKKIFQNISTSIYSQKLEKLYTSTFPGSAMRHLES
jgi:hypothetical protein